MVTSVTSLGRNGLQDWFLQRVSAVYLLAYMILLGYEFVIYPLTYSSLTGFFNSYLGQWSTLLAILLVLVHAWIGLWIVLTDYVKSTGLRTVLQSIVIVWLAAQVGWVICILWF